MPTKIYGEWGDESDVFVSPSLSWACNMLLFLLQSPVSRPYVVSRQVFQTLISYVRSDSAVAPVTVIPILIQLIRVAAMDGYDLELSRLDSLCNAIMKRAVDKVRGDKTSMLSDALVLLVDLVIELLLADAMSKHRLSHAQEALTGESFVDSGDTKDEFLEADNLYAIAIKDTPTVTSPDQVESNPDLVWFDKFQYEDKDLEIYSLLKLDELNPFFSSTDDFLLLSKLRNTLDFLLGLGVRDEDKNYIDVNHPLDLQSLPEKLAANIWYEHVSFCALEESMHPYIGVRMVKTVSFPGAVKLHVALDRRSSLGQGAVLRLTGSDHTWEFRGRDEGLWARTLVLPGCEFTYSFEVDSDGSTNPDHDWGWALVVGAEGPIYEVATASFEIPPSTSFANNKANTSIDSNGAERTSHQSMPPISNSATLEQFMSPQRLPRKPDELFNLTPSSMLSLDGKALEKITSAGELLHSGRLRVPRANEVEVIILRPNARPSESSSKAKRLFYVLRLTYNSLPSK